MSNSIRNQETLLLAHVVTDLAVQSAGQRSRAGTSLTNNALPANSSNTHELDLSGGLPNTDPVNFDGLAKELATVFELLLNASSAGGTSPSSAAGGAAKAATGTAANTTITTTGAATTTATGAANTTTGAGTTDAKTTAATTSTTPIQEPAGPSGGGSYSYPTDSSGNTIIASQLEVAPSVGINSSQIFQGTKTGDCVFLGILGSIGQANPEYLKNLIKPLTNASGQAETDSQGYPLYQVTLHQPNGQPWTYTTDAKFPGGAALSTPDADGKQDIGVPLLEKAMAAYNTQFNVFAGTGDDQGYDGISGGDSTKIMQALTGSTASLVDVQNMTAPQTTQLIASSLNKGVVAGIDRADTNTLSGKTLPSGAKVEPQTFNNGDQQWLYTTADGKSSETIPMAHAYSVLGVDTSANTVTLFNPWGVISGQNKGSATFTLPTADYQALMDTTTIGGVSLT